MKAETWSTEDVRLAKAVAEDINARPDFYRPGGAWLDAKYGEAAVAKRQSASDSSTPTQIEIERLVKDELFLSDLEKLCRSKDQAASSAAVGDLVIARALKNCDMTKKQFSQLRDKELSGHLDSSLPDLTDADQKTANKCREKLYAVYRERDRLLLLASTTRAGLRDDGLSQGHCSKAGTSDNPPSKLQRLGWAARLLIEPLPDHPTVDEAKRILIIHWLVTDPQAHERGLSLTEFEDWPWDSDTDAASSVTSRRCAGLHECFCRHSRIGRIWWELSQRAWTAISPGGGPSDVPSASEDKPSARRVGASVIVKHFAVSRSTLRRYVKDGRLTDLRPPGKKGTNSALILDLAEVTKYFTPY